MEVWAFWHNPCIYESAAATVSLHRTKQGAWKAKRRFLWTKATEARDFAIRYGGRDMMRRKMMEHESCGIESIDLED